MKRETPKQHEQPCLAICRKALSQIPSQFGRLAWISEHFDSSFGRYRDPDCERECGSEHVNHALRALHLVLFDKWLGLSLDDQLRDFRLFITSGATNVQLPAVVETRSEPGRLQQVPPPQSIGPDRELFRISLGLVLSLTAAQSRTTSDSIQIRRCMTTILTLLGNRGEPWKVTLEAVSQEVNLSADYVRHLFKKATGVTFHYYLRYVRINRAAHLLRSTFLSIEEVAASLGYAYTTNFPRDFRALLGISPATYRMVREVPDPLIEKFSIDVPRSDQE